MSRSYSRRGRGGYSRSRSDALRHIEEARALTAELGGMDQDVKKYFFGLPENELEKILIEYGRIYGPEAHSYAIETMPRWKSGVRQMSGMVAERLFNLLPPRMPLSAKYKLTEGLWEHFGPSSRKRLRIGLCVTSEEVSLIVRNHFNGVISNYRVPEQLEKRFNWLSSGDVSVKQDLLNNLRSQERHLIEESVRLQLPVMIRHMRQDSSNSIGRMVQVLKIGKHELHILVDPDATGASIEECTILPAFSKALPSSEGSVEDESHWVWWVAAIIVLAWIFLS